MILEAFLADLGVSLSAKAIHALAKSYFEKTTTPTPDGLQDHLASHLSVDGARIVAEKLVEFLAQNGNIVIVRSEINARDEITMASFPGTELRFGHGSTSQTDRTGIEAGPGAEIRAQGGAKIVQDPDGSIRFYT